MGAIRASVLTLLLALLLVSCAEGGPAHVPWPEGLSELSFLVRHADGAVIEYQGPFELGPDGRPTSKIELTLEEGEGVALLTLSLADLAVRSPRLVVEPLSNLELDVAFGDCESTLFDGYELVRLTSLEPRFLPLTGSSLPTGTASTLLEKLALRVPHDATRSCRSGSPPRLAPFMAELATPPDDSVIDGAPRDQTDLDVDWVYYAARGIAWLDEDRMALATPVYLYRLRRGETFTSTTSNTHRIAPAPPPLPGVGAWSISAIAVDPRSRGSGVDRILVAYSLDPKTAQPSALGAVWAYRFDEGGLIESRNLGETSTGLSSLSVDERGRFVAGGGAGWAYFGTVEDGVLEELSLGPGRDDTVTIVRENRSTFGASFYLSTNIAGVFALKLDDALVVALDKLAVPEPLSEPRGFDLLPQGDVSPELWMGTYAHGLQRRDVSGHWARRPLLGGLELAPCSAAERVCGRPSIGDFLTTVAVKPDGRVLLGPTTCNTALLLEPESGCIDPVLLPTETVGPLDRRARFYHAAISPAGQVAFIGNDRALLVHE